MNSIHFVLRLYLLMSGLTFFVVKPLFAQTVTQHSAWLSFKTSVSITTKTSFNFDCLIRSADKYDFVKNILWRPGLSYKISDKMIAGIGGVYSITKQNEQRIFTENLKDQRIWEQVEYKYKYSFAKLNSRIRLEQRFNEKTDQTIYSQRLRLMTRAVIPLISKGLDFKKGFFTGIQDEIFFNVQGKSKLNNHLFDQNRAQIFIGYKINGYLELDLSYLNQYQLASVGKTINHITQLTLSSRF